MANKMKYSTIYITRGHVCSSGDREQGVALLMALLVLVVLSVLVGGIALDVQMDLGISSNYRLKSEALNWGASGLNLAEETIELSHLVSGLNADWNSTFSLGNASFVLSNAGNSSLFVTDGALALSKDGTGCTTVDVHFLGRKIGEGGSIIIAAGYEGVGKGAAGSGGIQLFYQLQANGTSRHNALQELAETYRSIGR